MENFCTMSLVFEMVNRFHSFKYINSTQNDRRHHLFNALIARIRNSFSGVDKPDIKNERYFDAENYKERL